MAKAKRDKTTGLPLPSPVVPPTSICYTILVPNAPEYRSAFKGALSSLGQAWTWSQTEGQDNQAAFEAAELWRARIANSAYNLDCSEMPLDCLDVANCILTDPETQAAVGAIVPTTPIPGMTYPPAVPLTPGQMTARLNEIEDCAFDPFWAQSEQYIDFMVDLGQDVLEQIQVYSEALEAGQNVPMGQFLGKLKNSSTAGKVVDFLQWALTTVKAAYEAADTEGNRNALKCAIFCAGKDDCLITIQDTLDVLNERNGGLLSPGDLVDLPSLVDAFTSAFFNPALALDLWLLFLMGTAKTAGMFGLQGIDETLNLVLAVAVNDANNDWEILCEDCAPEPVDGCTDFTTTEGLWEIVPGTAEYVSGSGYKGVYFSGSNTTALWIGRPSQTDQPDVYEYRFLLNHPVDFTEATLFIAGTYVGGYFSVTGVSELVFSLSTVGGAWPKNGNAAIQLRLNIPGAADDFVTEACLVSGE